VSWERSEQLERHFGFMPRLTTYPQNAFMRLASLRADGCLFPIVGFEVTEKEGRLLKSLERDNKVFSVPTDSGVGVWSIHPSLGAMTLRPSTQRDGGNDDLDFLVQRGYFEKLPTLDPLMRWRTEGNMMVTLRLTQMGRNYINALKSGALIVSIDAVTPGDGDEIPDDASFDGGDNLLAAIPDAESRVDELRFQAWVKGKSLLDVLKGAVANELINVKTAIIYWMRRAEDPPRFKLEEVAKQVGVSKSEVQRREKACEVVLMNPKNLEILRAHLDQRTNA
jgi:hypothetical protein